MPTPRSQQISLSDTPYYHCISRCIRRTFLCGIDTSTNKDFSHRKQWIVERLALLSKTFAIDVCAYAIMSNHAHTVLKINDSLAQSWSDEQVMQRWEQLFAIPVLVERYLNGDSHSVLNGGWLVYRFRHISRWWIVLSWVVVRLVSIRPEVTCN